MLAMAYVDTSIRKCEYRNTLGSKWRRKKALFHMHLQFAAAEGVEQKEVWHARGMVVRPIDFVDNKSAIHSRRFAMAEMSSLILSKICSIVEDWNVGDLIITCMKEWKEQGICLKL